MSTSNEAPPFLALQANRRWRFEWLLPALFQPRQLFPQIAAATTGVGFTPIMVLITTAVIRVLVTGSLRQAAAARGQIPLPPGFEFYTPEQQAQFQQAMTATSGPIFTYLLPAVTAVLGILFAWLVISALLHLVLTLLGGRGSSRQMFNVVAWSLLPFAVRDVVRIVAMLNSNQLLTSPGLSGFAPTEGGTLSIYLTALLALVDLYAIWQLILLGIGVRASVGLTAGKVWGTVLVTMVVILLARALPAVIAAQFSDQTIIRPFF